MSWRCAEELGYHSTCGRGVPIELTIIMLKTFFRAWVLMTHEHFRRGLAWIFVAVAALVVPAWTHLMSLCELFGHRTLRAIWHNR